MSTIDRKEVSEMMGMGDMADRCMDAVGSMMGSPMMGGIGLLILAILFVIWLLGLAAVGAIGVWGYRKLKAGS
jgi:hypothetical protein